MENNSPDSFKGQLLMAMPLLIDHNFYQTVTCICEYTPAGTVGIVINRLHPSLTVKDILDELNMGFISDVESTPIHIGGPVHVGEIFILHAYADEVYQQDEIVKRSFLEELKETTYQKSQKALKKVLEESEINLVI